MKRLLVFYCVFNLGLISKKEPSRRLLWQKRDYSRDSRQFISHCLSRYRPLFSSADKFFVCQSYRIFFCVEQPLIIVRPSADFFFFLDLSSVGRHLGIWINFFSSVGWRTPIVDRKWIDGRLVILGDFDTDFGRPIVNQ